MKTKSYFSFYLVQILLLIAVCYCQTGGVLSIQNTFINNLQINLNQGCKTFFNGICQECQQGYLFNKDRKCLKIIENCRLFNLESGICEQCNEGFLIIEGKCSMNQTIQVSDPGCKIWTNNKCRQCSYKWFMDTNGKCQQIDDNCQTWNNSGYCLGCYDGYQPNQGKCILSKSNPAAFNTLCKKFNNGICVECSYRAFFDNNGICKQVNRNCNTFNESNGICYSCYDGFVLTNGTCVFLNNPTVTDPLCKIFDSLTKKCVQCSYRSYKNQQGICTEVNPLCMTFNQGTCLSCYSGYILTNGQCIMKKQQFSLSPTDPGCSRWNWPQKKCIRCQYRYYFNYQGICTKVSDSCKTYDLISGKCLSCYDQIEAKGKKYFLNKMNQCVEVTPFCKIYQGTSGFCKQCQQGYFLINGVCQAQNPNFITEGCFLFDIKTNKCQSCQNDYYLTSNNLCMKKPVYCQICHQDGKCAKCLEGFYLQNGLCIKYKVLGCKNPLQTNCTLCQNDYLLIDGKCINLNELRKLLNLNTQSPS